MLSTLTLLAIALGYAASKTGVRGRRSRVLQAVCSSTTVLFHMITGFTEALTRLPLGRPLFAIVLLLQIWWFRAELSKAPLARRTASGRSPRALPAREPGSRESAR